MGIGTYFGIYFGSIAFFYVVYDYGVLTNLPSGGTAVIERVSVFALCGRRERETGPGGSTEFSSEMRRLSSFEPFFRAGDLRGFHCSTCRVA